MSGRFEDEHHPFGPSVARLINQFATLPGIGRKTAERLAHHILSCREEEALELAEAIREVKANIRKCSVCFNLTDQEQCEICRDPRRDRTSICVVETPKDVTILERASAFGGTYHVLGGVISPLDGVGPDQLQIESLLKRAKEDQPEEIIFALNPNTQGDTTIYYCLLYTSPSPRDS